MTENTKIREHVKKVVRENLPNLAKDTPARDYASLNEAVARAICKAAGRDPNAPFQDKHGRSLDFPEWERWQAEAGAAIRAVAAHTPARDEIVGALANEVEKLEADLQTVGEDLTDDQGKAYSWLTIAQGRVRSIAEALSASRSGEALGAGRQDPDPFAFICEWQEDCEKSGDALTSGTATRYLRAQFLRYAAACAAPIPPEVGAVEGLVETYDAGFAASGEGWNGEYPDDACDSDHYRVRRDATLTTYRATQSQAPAAEGGEFKSYLEDMAARQAASLGRVMATPPSVPSQVDDGGNRSWVVVISIIHQVEDLLDEAARELDFEHVALPCIENAGKHLLQLRAALRTHKRLEGSSQADEGEEAARRLAIEIGKAADDEFADWQIDLVVPVLLAALRTHKGESVPEGHDAAVALFRKTLPEWTSHYIEIRTQRCMTRYVVEIARLADNDDGEQRETGHGKTPLEAMRNAIRAASLAPQDREGGQ